MIMMWVFVEIEPCPVLRITIKPVLLVHRKDDSGKTMKKLGKSTMSSKLIYRFICVLILLALLVPMSENPLRTSKAAAQSIDAPKLQGYLATLAQQAPGERVAIIVQKQGASDEAEQIVSRNGGQVTKALPMLNAFAAVVPVRLLTQLEQSTAVRWVSLDAPVVSQNSTLPGAVTIQDDFAAVAYNGSTGSFAWQSDWAEIGEADGAEQGDVRR